MPRKANNKQSVPGALDAIMLDSSWQIGLTDEQRWKLVDWAKHVLSGRFESALLDVRSALAKIGKTPVEQQETAIQALLVDTQG